MIKDDSFQSGKVLFLQAVIIQVFEGTKQKPSQNQLFNSTSSAPTPACGSWASESSRGSQTTPLLPTSHSLISPSPALPCHPDQGRWCTVVLPEQQVGPAVGVAAPGVGSGLASLSPRHACPRAWPHLLSDSWALTKLVRHGSHLYAFHPSVCSVSLSLSRCYSL